MQIYEYYDEYSRARDNSDADAEGRWAHQLTWEVARHAVGEEIVVYPLMEKHLGEKGQKLTDKDRADHQVRAYLDCQPLHRLTRIFSQGRQGASIEARVALPKAPRLPRGDVEDDQSFAPTQ